MLMALSRLMCALPRPWALRLGRAVAWLWYHVIPLRRGVARRNVERAFGASLSARRKRRIVRDSFANACLYAVEGLRMPLLTAASSRELVRREHMERIDALLARGRGIIAVTAHIGNFDLLGTSQTVRGYPVHAILKDISWPQAQLFWGAVRDATGLGRVAPRRSRERIVELLAHNQIVAFLIDQHMAAHRAIVCEFFGQLAATTPAPVRLALRTGAPIMPIVIYRTDWAGHHCIEVAPEFELECPHADEEANVRHNTERLSRLCEAWVRRWPEQWLWMHRRWKVQDAPQGWAVPAHLRHLAGDVEAA